MSLYNSKSEIFNEQIVYAAMGTVPLILRFPVY